MSDTEQMPPQPEPDSVPGETVENPGGADAVDESIERDPMNGEPLARDLDPEDNAAVDDEMSELPDEMSETEDTDTEATKDQGENEVGPEDDDGQRIDPEEESPA